MDAFLLHLLLLIWTSLATARQLWLRPLEQLVAAGLLSWANLVTVSLILGIFHRLGDPQLFLGVSAVLGLLSCLGVNRIARATNTAATELPASSDRWSRRIFFLILAPFAAANILTAYLYLPNNPDALSHVLPRSLFYWHQGNLAPFSTNDPRQILLPFNYSLGQLIGLIYGAPQQVLNFFNVIAWIGAGLAVYGLSRLAGLRALFSLSASALALLCPVALAQAATTTPELPAAAALLGGLVFAVRWWTGGATRDAWLVGIAWGLAAGTDLGTAFFLSCVLPLWLLWTWRRSQPGSSRQLSALIGPACVMLTLALPFVVVTIASLPKNVAYPSAIQREWLAWTSVLPSADNPTLGTNLHEDLVNYGLIGVAVLFSTTLCAARLRPPGNLLTMVARGSLIWIAAFMWFHRDQPLLPRDFLPVFLLMSPCLPAVLSAAWMRFPNWSSVTLVCLILVSGWSSGVYLLNNGRRPLGPWLKGISLPASRLPLELEMTLAQSPWVHFDSPDGSEPLLALMRGKPRQRFTTGPNYPPEALILFSRLAASRSAGWQTSTPTCSRLIPYPGKPTPGVRFVATDPGPEARDYYALPPLVSRTSSTPEDQHLLLTISNAGPSLPPSTITIQVVGLNPADQARLVVLTTLEPALNQPIAEFHKTGITSVQLPPQAKSVVCQLVSQSTNTELARLEIPTRTSPSSLRTAADQLFGADVVLVDSPKIVISDGLHSSENLLSATNQPYVRWARKPAIQLRVPPLPRLRHLRLSFSLSSPLRTAAAVEIRFNGVAIHQYRLAPANQWLEKTLDLTPQAGSNTIEFVDVPLTHEPDWLGYLERYSDVRDYLLASNIPPEAGAQEHYETSGRAEGREMRYRALPPPPDSRYFVFRSLRLEGFPSP